MAMINTAGNSSTISALRMKWILFFQIVSKNPRVSAHIIWFNLYLSLHLKILSDLVIHTPPPRRVALLPHWLYKGMHIFKRMQDFKNIKYPL